MKVLCKQLMLSWLLGSILPWMLSSLVVQFCTPEAMQLPGYSKEQVGHEKLPEEMHISVLHDGEIITMELEDYIRSVVLGEVSESFAEEALKAQAVAARTYTLSCVLGGAKHPDGAVCTDYRCCQAYREPEEYLSSGGTAEGLRKIQYAVESTAGEVLYYNGELICATYYASSGGMTEDAREVWGTAYPYLVPVSSPGEEDSGYYHQAKTFEVEEFRSLLGVDLQGNPRDWFGMVVYTAGNGVDLMRIGGRLYTGVELRSRLGLRSTVFSVSVTDTEITFQTKGYGHRVGMSQHGANAMAKQGRDYRKILVHYYPGTTLSLYLSDSH